MADAWVHAVLSLIAFGKTYFDLHKQIVLLFSEFSQDIMLNKECRIETYLKVYSWQNS